ncbi:MAG: potassium channel family protein [Chloroflexota bacterium]
MKRQVVVIGLGRFGASLARTLFQLGYEVLAVDVDGSRTQALASDVTQALQLDATSEAALQDIDVGSFPVGIVGIGSSIERSVLATILLKRHGVKYVVARAVDELHGSILEKIGADAVIYPEDDAGHKLAHRIHERNVVEYIPVVGHYGVAKLIAPQYFTDRKLSELGLNQKDGVAVVLIQRGEEILLNPRSSEKLQSGDILIIAGNDRDLEELLAQAQEKFQEKEPSQ